MKKLILMVMAVGFFFLVPPCLIGFDARDCDIDGDGDVDGDDLLVFSQFYGGTYSIWYQDADGDGFGNSENTLAKSTQPDGYVDDNQDCDDTDASVNPDAEESCDEIDNNCDGEIDNSDLCLPSVITNSAGMVFLLVTEGVFQMGSPESELGRSPGNIETQHTVTLSRPFYMQETEVTQCQWEAVMGELPSQLASSGRGVGDEYPVYYVSWEDAQSFIDKLNELGEGTYRLPTEAEWEYTARAGSTTAFPGGEITDTEADDPVLNDIGWYKGNSENATHTIGQKVANDLGFYDMHGNVGEWCLDYYEEYSSEPATDPSGPLEGTNHVARGGFWNGNASTCRSASRNNYAPDLKSPAFGFRVLREYN